MKTLHSIVQWCITHQDPSHGPFTKSDLYIDVYYSLEEHLYCTNIFTTPDYDLPF